MKRKINLSRSHLLWATMCLFLLLPVAAFGQSSGAADKKRLRLQISINRSEQISVRAEKVSTNELAAELSRQLKIPVILSGIMRDKIANLTFQNLPLEEAALRLAPHARVDYVLMQNETGAQMLRPLAVYLSGYNEKAPSTVQSVEKESPAIVVEGNTETLDKAVDEGSFKINFDENRLTVLARRQNLTFVVAEIAARADLEFDLRYDTDKLIDIEIENEPLTEALVRLSPHVRVYLRKDLLTAKTIAFRVALTESNYPIRMTK